MLVPEAAFSGEIPSNMHCYFLEVSFVKPPSAQPRVFQPQQHADRDKRGIPVSLRGRRVSEGTQAGIISVDEISSASRDQSTPSNRVCIG